MSAPLDIANLRFLVVEDHGFQRWAMGNVLQALGAKYVFPAADGHAALEIFRNLEEPIDIIVSDLDMPGMDGMEFIRHVGLIGTPVSLILASSLERAVIATVETMARAYGVTLLGAIEKPPTSKKLAAVIALHRAPAEAPRRAPAAREVFELAEVVAGMARGEFEPFFQPKVEMQSRDVVGAEAMARWRHPQKGIIGPAAFLPLLQAAGRLGGLMDIMLKQAAATCSRWRGDGYDATVSLNLSPDTLVDLELAERLTRVVAAEGLEGRDVIFEVTESAMAADIGRALENLSRLRVKGFGLSLDDYGTGYSSMQQLARIPFTELKIDQSFVRNAATRPSDRAVLESSLEIAQKLGIVAVAEGVESQAEWDMLREMGCRLAQGYFIGHPMGAHEFLAWLAARRAGG
jgi:EAL domain-containing protein (putative c-di-GMP-specific phosphodiesterase class I)